MEHETPWSAVQMVGVTMALRMLTVLRAVTDSLWCLGDFHEVAGKPFSPNDLSRIGMYDEGTTFVFELEVRVDEE